MDRQTARAAVEDGCTRSGDFANLKKLGGRFRFMRRRDTKFKAASLGQ